MHVWLQLEGRASESVQSELILVSSRSSLHSYQGREARTRNREPAVLREERGADVPTGAMGSSFHSRYDFLASPPGWAVARVLLQQLKSP